MDEVLLENIVSIDSLCRTCMRHDDGENMLSLFDSVVTMGEGMLTPLSQMLSNFIRMEVTILDELPKRICLNCVEHVKQSYVFWQQCRNSSQTMKHLIRTSVEGDLDPNEKSTQTDSVSLHQCEMCDKSFTEYEELKKHRMQHKSDGFKCRFCGKSYTRLSYLKGHMSVMHPSAQAQSSSFTKKCCCPVCDKQFTRPEHMRRHMLLHENAGGIRDETPEAEVEEDTLEANTIDNSDDDHHADADADEDFSSIETQAKEVNPDQTADTELISEEKLEEEPNNPEVKNDDVVTEVHEEDRTTDIITDGEDSPNKSTKTESSKQCPECFKSFTRVTHMRRHMSIHKGIKPFSCTVCLKDFTRSDHLTKHMLSHSDEQSFHCHPCKKQFKRSERYTLHMKNHHSKENPEATKSPSAIDPTTVCDICHKSFSSAKYLKIHAKTHCEDFSCKTCVMKFDSRSELQKHAKTHINERPFLCSECGLRFVRNDYLVVHMRRHKGEKPYKCKFCGKGFPRATDLTVHERYHTGEKTHLCTICGKGFQRAYNLLVHMRIHTGEKPYQCPHCVKSFAQGNDLKAHIRRHTGERYKCDICGEGFIQGYHLTQHKRSVHNLDVKSHIRRVEKFPVDAKEELEGELRELEILDNFPEEVIDIKIEPTAVQQMEHNSTETSLDGNISYHPDTVSILYVQRAK